MGRKEKVDAYAALAAACETDAVREIVDASMPRLQEPTLERRTRRLRGAWTDAWCAFRCVGGDRHGDVAAVGGTHSRRQSSVEVPSINLLTLLHVSLTLINPNPSTPTSRVKPVQTLAREHAQLDELARVLRVPRAEQRPGAVGRRRVRAPEAALRGLDHLRSRRGASVSVGRSCER